MAKQKRAASLMLEGINKAKAVKRMASGMNQYAKKLKKRIK